MDIDPSLPPSRFDPLARLYKWLERLAFGGALARARLHFIDRLSACRNVLILGEGDGRFVERLVQVAPHAHIRCIDRSASMLQLAEHGIAGLASEERVRFEQADARHIDYPDEAYDAVVTCFFLDCFVEADVADLVTHVGRSLRPGGVWLFADFAIPERGWRRLRARLWLAGLYAFFRWRVSLEGHVLPPSEDLLLKLGLRRIAECTSQAGLVRTALFEKPRDSGSAP